MDKHPFIQPSGKYKGCAFKDLNTGEKCHKRVGHVIHKMPKPKMYKPGEGVNGYTVQPNGEWRKPSS